MLRSTSRRRPTRSVVVGGVGIGGGSPIRVQSMCDTDTRDVSATVAQIDSVVEAGCELIRVAVPDITAARALGQIKSRISIPIIADVHFDHRLALEAIDQGADKVRINPGNILARSGRDGVDAIIRAVRDGGIALRIGVNSGSIERRLLEKHGHPTPEAAIESALGFIRHCEDLGLERLIISVKFSDVPRMVQANRLLAERTDYPIHLGVTEAGTSWSGTIKSSVGIGTLLTDGIGDTVRVSLTTSDKREEVRVAYEILKSLEIRAHGPILTVCPGCGRTEVDLLRLANQVEGSLAGVRTPLRIAVMGCIVNGPGEAAEADLAVVGGRGRGAIYRRGELVCTANESELVNALMSEVADWREG